MKATPCRVKVWKYGDWKWSCLHSSCDAPVYDQFGHADEWAKAYAAARIHNRIHHEHPVLSHDR